MSSKKNDCEIPNDGFQDMQITRAILKETYLIEAKFHENMADTSRSNRKKRCTALDESLMNQ
jgi:hypothetical protein